MSEDKEARVYTVESLAEHAKVSRRTIYNLIKAGKIRASSATAGPTA